MLPVPSAPPTAALRLVQEYKLAELLGPELGQRWEASGVCLADGRLCVIFDNTPHLARLPPPPWNGRPTVELFRQRGEGIGYEDIAYATSLKRFHLLIEADAFAPGAYQARIETYDADFRYLETAWVNFPLDRPNKGLEGVTTARRDGQDYLLALCEGNKCRAGALGRRPGGGRIHVLHSRDGRWEPVAKLRLPKSLRFEDYASLDLVDDRLVVVSQASAAAWVGRLQPGAWEVVDEGQTYPFPLGDDGQPVYCNAEGVAWLSPRQIVVVSDRAKPGEQPKKCRDKDQSIHIFELP
jgi:hypothetical protein